MKGKLEECASLLEEHFIHLFNPIKKADPVLAPPFSPQLASYLTSYFYALTSIEFFPHLFFIIYFFSVWYSQCINPESKDYLTGVECLPR
jgi:hypothetical protein